MVHILLLIGMPNKSKVIKSKWNQKSSQKASWITVQLHAWLLNCEHIILNTDKIKILMDTQNKTSNLETDLIMTSTYIYIMFSSIPPSWNF